MTKRSAAAFSTALLAAVCTGGVQATEYGSSGPTFCSIETPDNCLDGISIGGVSPDAIRRVSELTSDIASERAEEQGLAGRTGPLRPSGLAAGEHYGNVSLWANVMHTEFSSDFVIDPASSPLKAHDSEVTAGMFGADVLLMDRLVLGAAFGYEDSESDTPYNGGDHESDGFSITPYAALLLTDFLSIDVSGGYAWLDNEQLRIDRQGAVPLTSSFDSERTFFAANLAAFTTRGDWTLGATVGYLYTEQTEDGYTEQGSPADARTVREREIDLSQIVIGADASYRFGSTEMFGFANYRNDLSRDDGRGVGGLPGATGPVQPDDDDEVEVGVGARFTGGDNWSGTAELSRILGRDEFSSWTGAVTLRVNL